MHSCSPVNFQALIMDPDPARWAVSCPVCKCHFPMESMLPNHMEQAHSTLACYHCPLTFRDTEAFKEHLLTHGIVEDTPGPKSICAVCNAVFMEQSQLNAHLRMHETGELRAPRRRRRRPKGIPLGRISTIPVEGASDPMGIARLPPKSQNFEQFYENYTRIEELKPEAMEFYCGICGEGVSKSKFATHILNHLHVIFELRKGKGLAEPGQTKSVTQDRDCDNCKELWRRVRDMLEVMEGNNDSARENPYLSQATYLLKRKVFENNVTDYSRCVPKFDSLKNRDAAAPSSA